MSLRIIYGESGTGKTTFCFNEIKEKIKNEERVIIITPEQASFDAEKKLLSVSENNASIYGEVLSMSRIAHRVLSEVGGSKKIALTESSDAMIIYYLLDKNKEKLEFLSGNKKNIDTIISLIGEFKKNNITCKMIKEVMEKTEDRLLQIKLRDIFIIYEEYERFKKDKYIDSMDKMNMLKEKLPQSHMFDNTFVYLDGFLGFTKQELEVIKIILTKAKMVSITICTNSLNEVNGREIFDTSYGTIRKILEISQNIPLEKSVGLTTNYRLKSNDLKALEKNIYTKHMKIYDGDIPNIHLTQVKNQYEEIENVAKNILKLVREENYNYRDIIIVSENLGEYGSLAKAIFNKYEIPIYIDEKKPLNENVVIKYLISIFNIFSDNFTFEKVMEYIKTGLIDITEEEIFDIEIYAKKWGIRGAKWYKGDFEFDKENEDLDNLNSIRNKIVTPLIYLKEKLKEEKTGSSFCKSIYDFLQKQNIYLKVKEMINEFYTNGNIELARQYETSINVISQILDEIYSLFENQKMDFECFRDLLDVAISHKNLGSIPATQDEVIFGDIRRSKNSDKKILFFIGLNDGAIPRSHKNEGFLLDENREKLKEKGLDIASTTIDHIKEEEFDIYKTLSMVSDKIYLSFPISDMESKALRPSILISKIKKIFPNLKIELEEYTTIGNIETTFDDLAIKLYEVSTGKDVEDMWIDIYNFYCKNERYNEKLKDVIDFTNKTNINLKISKEMIDNLYENNMKTSISKLESYRRCPFSYFLKYGLKLKEEEKLEINPIDTGSFMHEVIEDFFEMGNAKLLSENEIKENIKKIVSEKIMLPKNKIYLSSKKFAFLVTRLEKVLFLAVNYITESLKNSDFEIMGNELTFESGGDFKPIRYTLDDGKNVEIVGKIDRVDILKNEKGNYVRIIDYKSSVKNIDLSEMRFGIKLQLITYLNEIVKEKDFLPAGILYFNLIEPIINADSSKTEEEIKEQIKKEFKMKGIVLADIDIIKSMDKNLEKKYSDTIPVYIGANGEISDSKSNILNKEDFTLIQKMAEKTIKEIANEIYSGSIDIKPYYDKQKSTPCSFCKFRSICNFDENKNGYNFIDYKSKDDILEEIKKEE